MRFTLRWLMLAVAVVALGVSAFLGAYPKIARRRAESQGRARQHAHSEQMLRLEMRAEARNLGLWAALAAERRLKGKGARPADDEDRPPVGEESWASLAEQADAQSAWHARRIQALHRQALDQAALRCQWELAAALPFLPVPREPPPEPGR